MKATTDYTGIDYGMGQTNRNRETGIRFGVIPQNEVLQAWADSSGPDYGDPTCPKCGNGAKPARGEYKRYEHAAHECSDYVCHDCKYVFGSESAYGDEPHGFCLDDGEYKATCGEDGDIFILSSPYFTHAQFCSPCAPGAGYLTDRGEDCAAFCFGPDMFDDQPPHNIYEVATGRLVCAGRK